ncbi:MAG: tripartite tricarboxylate transporter substrate binding protein [Pseudomonadota bacterium]|jgi:tripartite-type tricarboxylate transporter receptor subunit TctC
MNFSQFRRRAVLAGLALASLGVMAQTPLRIITSDQAGGAMDALIRPMAEKLATQVGRPVVVDNKPGAQGRIAGGALLAAPADGNSLLITVQAGVVINPHVYKYPYDPLTDLVPVTDLGRGSVMLLMPSTLPPRNFKELVDWGRAQPKGSVHYGTYSPGTISHFGGMLLAQEAQLDLTAVHYKASADTVRDLLAGTVQMAWSGPAGPVAQLIKAGRLRPMAYMGPKRLPMWPDVPTVRELGYPGIESDGWIGIFAAKGTTPEQVRYWQAEISKVLARPEIQALYANFGFQPGGTGSAEFADTVKADSPRWGQYIQKIGYKAE